MTRLSIAEAKARFADAVKKAEAGEPVIVTRYGSDVVALIPVGELAELRRLRTANAGAGLVTIAGGWKDSAELAANIATVQRSRSRTR